SGGGGTSGWRSCSSTSPARRDGGGALIARADRELGLAYAAAPLLRAVASRTHTVPAVVVVVTALVHIHVVDERVSTLVKQVPWGLMTAAFGPLGAWARSSRRRSPSSSRASRS